jgi:hypothetical protein
MSLDRRMAAMVPTQGTKSIWKASKPCNDAAASFQLPHLSGFPRPQIHKRQFQAVSLSFAPASEPGWKRLGGTWARITIPLSARGGEYPY